MLDFAPGCVKTNQTALRFHQALKAGQPYSCDAEWQHWQRQHPCTPPLDPAAGFGTGGAAGDDQAGWTSGRARQAASLHADGGGAATPGPAGRTDDICFRCKQPGGQGWVWAGRSGVETARACIESCMLRDVAPAWAARGLLLMHQFKATGCFMTHLG